MFNIYMSSHLFVVITLFSFQGSVPSFLKDGGDKEIRTLDPLLARQVLSQLSYTPRVSSLVSFLAVTGKGN